MGDLFFPTPPHIEIYKTDFFDTLTPTEDLEPCCPPSALAGRSTNLDFVLSYPFPPVCEMQRDPLSRGVSGLISSDERMVKQYQKIHHDEGPFAFPYRLASQQEASPECWWFSDRSALKHDDSSGCSTWSPLTSEGRLEADLKPSSQLSHWNNTQSTSAPCFSNYSASFTSDPGIALHDIQPDPDAHAEEPSRRPLRGSMLDQRSSLESSGLPPPQIDPMGDDKDVENVSLPTDYDSNDNEAIMDNDIDDGDASEYTPEKSHKRSHRHGIRKTITQNSRHFCRTKSSLTPSRISKKTLRKHVKPIAPNPSSPSSPASKADRMSCAHCPSLFPSRSTLTKHTLAMHTRPFSCIFHRYGCPATFGSKNEWKRHVSSQHLRPGIYRCDIGACAQQTTSQYRRKSSSSSMSSVRVACCKNPESNETALGGGAYNDFNRKDLFTQHVRRMHSPASDAQLETIRQRCWIQLRSLPPQSICGFCHGSDPTGSDHGKKKGSREGVFEGKDSWDERMEHVSKHLEKQQVMADGEEGEDVPLRSWMLDQGLLNQEGNTFTVVGCTSQRKSTKASVRLGMMSTTTTTTATMMTGSSVDGDSEEDGECEDE